MKRLYYLNLICAIAFSFFGGITQSFAQEAQPYENMSEEDMEKLFAQLQQEIESYIQEQSPEVQREFYEAQEKYARMSDEELEQELATLLTEEKQQGPQFPMDDIEEPALAPSPEPEKREPIKEAIARYDSLLHLIDTLQKETSELIVKISTIPDVSRKIDQWIKDGKIKDWHGQKTWTVFLHEIEQLNNQFERMKEKDPKTDQYKYLEDLLSNEQLKENLSSLQTILMRYGSTIEVESFGLAPMKSEAKNALRIVVSEYAHALYVSNISEQLSAIFEKYEPEAEKRRQEEKKLQEQAARQPFTTGPGSAIVGGRPAEPRGDASFDSPYFGDYAGDMDYSYRQPSGISGYTPSRFDSDPFGDKTGEQDGSLPKGSGAITPGMPAESDIAPQQEGLGDVRFMKKDPETMRILNRIETKLDDIGTLISDNPHFSDITSYLTDPAHSITENDLFAYHTIPQLDKRITETSSEVRALLRKIRNASKNHKAYYKTEVQSFFEKISPQLQSISETVQDIEKNWDDIQVQIANDKKQVYFKGRDIQAPKVAVKPVDPEIETPEEYPVVMPDVSLLPEATKTFFDLQQDIDTLTTLITKFSISEEGSKK